MWIRWIRIRIRNTALKAVFKSRLEMGMRIWILSKKFDIITIYAPIYGPMRNIFDAGRYVMWASGRGLGPGNREFFGPLWNDIEPIGECHLGPKKPSDSPPSPPPIQNLLKSTAICKVCKVHKGSLKYINEFLKPLIQITYVSRRFCTLLVTVCFRTFDLPAVNFTDRNQSAKGTSTMHRSERGSLLALFRPHESAYGKNTEYVSVNGTGNSQEIKTLINY